MPEAPAWRELYPFESHYAEVAGRRIHYLDEGSGFIEVTGNVVYNVARAINFNNRAQDRIDTCHVHDNFFDIDPGDRQLPAAARQVMAEAGPRN